MKCKKKFDLEYVKGFDKAARCDSCNSLIRPDVILYGEGLDQGKISLAINYIANADVLIIGGTSLVVYPAAGLIDFYRGDKLILINKEQTPRDNLSNVKITGDIAWVMDQLVEGLDE